MRRDEKEEEKSKIKDDSWNRTYYGSPTLGGFLVVGATILYILFKAF